MFGTSLRARLGGGTAIALLVGLTALAVPGLAAAADPSNGPDQSQKPVATAPRKDVSTNVSEVTIVGSHIRRDNFNSPSPVDIITHDEATIAGFATSSDVLLGTAVTTGQAQINSAFGNFVVNGGGGVNTLGLRGLDPSRTLILLNGRRITPGGSRGAVGAADLNVVPDAIIDHYEILKDGASSIYGSDAIAGVVNIVTKQNIQGVTLDGYFSAPQGWAGSEARASVVGGVKEDRWQFSGSFDYYNRTDLKLKDRDWTQCNTSFTFNPDGSSADFIDPMTGHPKCYPIDGTGDNGVTINTLGTATRAGVPAAGVPAGIGRFNRWRPNASVTTGIPGYEGVGLAPFVPLDVRDTFDPRMLEQSILSPTKNYHIFSQGSYDLQALGDSQLYFEVLGSRRDSSEIGYRQLTVDYPKFATCGVAGATTENPLLPSNIACLGTFPLSSTITHGLPVAVRAFIGYGNLPATQRENYYKLVGGLRGNFALPGWKYDVGVWYAKSDTTYAQGTFLASRLSNSLNVVAAPAGTSAALVRNGLTCAVNIGNPAANCIPAPVLTPDVIGGHLPPDWTHYITANAVGTTIYDETAVSAEFDGPVYHLPYGDIKAALGAEFRSDYLNDTPPIASQTGDLYNLTSAAITRGSDNVWEGYGEVEIPILKDLPLAHELTVDGSVRYTTYRSYGPGWTYKVTGTWAPTDWFSFRGTEGTSFRAPALFEQFLGATSGFLNQQKDPCNDYGAFNPNTNVYKNCVKELGPPDPTNPFTQKSSITVLTAGGSTLGLKAETSRNYTFGFITQPKLGPVWGDFSFSADYFSIVIDNGVDRVGALNLLGLCYNSSGFRAAGGFCSFINPRNPGTGALTVRDSYTNIATNVVRGVDYDLRYVRPLFDGKLTINAQVTQYLEQANKVLPTDGLQQLNGTVTEPAYAGTLETIFQWQKWRFRYGLDWLSATNSYNQIFGDPTVPKGSPAVPGCGFIPTPPCYAYGANLATTGFVYFTPNYWLHAISIEYREPTWQVTVGIDNLTDQKPPSISFGFFNRVGNAPLYIGYDYVGRRFFIDVSKKF